MNKYILLLSLMIASMPVSAIGKDKKGHLIAGMAIGITVTFGTKKPKWGFATGCAAGLAKEAYDSTGRGTVEFQDFAYTCAGAALSSWAIGKLIK